MEKSRAIELLKLAVPIKALTQQEYADFVEAVNMGMDALEQPTSPDTIDRQAVIKVLECWQKAFKENSHHASASDLSLVVKDIRALSATHVATDTNVGSCSEIPNNSDCISRQAVSSWLKQYGQDVLHGKYKFSLMYIWKNLMDLPSVQPEQRWIPCDMGEPDEDVECWVTVKTTNVLYRGNFTKRYGERRDKGFITSGGFMWWNTALAWMPIYEPEPYRQEGEDKHEG